MVQGGRDDFENKEDFLKFRGPFGRRLFVFSLPSYFHKAQVMCHNIGIFKTDRCTISQAILSLHKYVHVEDPHLDL